MRCWKYGNRSHSLELELTDENKPNQYTFQDVAEVSVSREILRGESCIKHQLRGRENQREQVLRYCLKIVFKMASSETTCKSFAFPLPQIQWTTNRPARTVEWGRRVVRYFSGKHILVQRNHIIYFSIRVFVGATGEDRIQFYGVWNILVILPCVIIINTNVG